MVVCPKDLREGTITDSYLAPAITRFAIKIGKQEEHNPTLSPEERELFQRNLSSPPDMEQGLRRTGGRGHQETS
jgi:hypothetical protein